jgi:hypothetical protein
MTLHTRFDRFALGRLPTGKMNKTETAYASHLELRKRTGDVLWFEFEGIKLRLADKTFLTIDFPVLRGDGLMEMHDIKGGPIMDDANVKIKVAAKMYPFKFFIVRKKSMFWSMVPVLAQDAEQSA